jgi:hypothetical protein
MRLLPVLARLAIGLFLYASACARLVTGTPDLAATNDRVSGEAPRDLASERVASDRAGLDGARDLSRREAGEADHARPKDLPAPDAKPRDLAAPDAKPKDLAALKDLPCAIFSFSIPSVAHQPPATTILFSGGGGIEVKGSRPDCTAAVSVSGPGAPSFDVDGSSIFVTTATVSVGQRVRLRVTTAATAGATIAPQLSIGPHSASWSVSTCSGATCMKGAIGSNLGCASPSTRVFRWKCPGSTEWIYASDFTFQFAGTGLLSCPAGASCEWDLCGGNGWATGTLACP